MIKILHFIFYNKKYNKITIQRIRQKITYWIIKIFMVNTVIIDDNWKGELRNIALKFNNFAKKGSLRMASFIIDKLFDVMSDDNNTNNHDAAQVLKRIRAVNPKLISPYISTLLEARLGQHYFQSGEYINPDHSRYPATRNPMNDIVIYNDDNPSDEKKSEEKEEGSVTLVEYTEPEKQEKGSEQEEDAGGELLSWDLMQLLQFKIVKNIKPITYAEVDTPTRKCTCADGKFEKGEAGIWGCTKCMAPYHENCIKIVSILEGRCRICEESFLVGEESEEEDDTKP